MRGLLRRLFGLKTEADYRRDALLAVENYRPKDLFSSSTNGPSDEECSKVELYRHVIERPGEYFMCAWCGDGPWHQTWYGEANRLRSLGPCCSGAD